MGRVATSLMGHIRTIEAHQSRAIKGSWLWQADQDFQMTAHTIVHCDPSRHAGAILDIFNEAILTSTALYDYKPRSPSSMISCSRPR